MDIYINLDALDLKTAAVVSKNDLRSKPLKELVAGENQVINLYTTAKTGSPNIQDYSTVRVGIGTINAVPTSGSYTVQYGTKSETIAYNETASSIASKFYNLTDAQISGVTTISPQTFKIDFQYTGSVAVPSITDDTGLYPASTVTISELAVGSATTKASWLLKTNQDALALTSTFTNISPQGISGVLNTATTGIYEKLQSSKFFKTTLEVEVVDSASRLSTILQVPISVKGEVIGLSVEPPHATPSPYALVTYVDSKTAANATNIAANTSNINSLNDGEQINSEGIAVNSTNIATNTATIASNSAAISSIASNSSSNSADISSNTVAISLKAPIADPTFSGNVILGNTTNNTKKFTKQKSYGTNGAVEIQRGTSTDDQLTFRWDGPTSKNFSIQQYIDGVAEGQIKFAIDPSTNNKLSLIAKIVDVGQTNTVLTKLFSDTNLGAQKKFVFVDSRNENHGLQFKHSGPNSPTFQIGMAGAAYNSSDFGQLKVRHTTSLGVTEDVIVVAKDNAYTKLESDRTEMKNAKVADGGYMQVGSFDGTTPSSPQEGMIIFDSANGVKKFKGYTGSGGWVDLH
jgi:hypothetical protein